MLLVIVVSALPIFTVATLVVCFITSIILTIYQIKTKPCSIKRANRWRTVVLVTTSWSYIGYFIAYGFGEPSIVPFLVVYIGWAIFGLAGILFDYESVADISNSKAKKIALAFNDNEDSRNETSMESIKNN